MKTKQTIAGWLMLLALLSTLNPQLSAAPLGTAFSYQGKLSTGTNAANGSYDFSFALYDAAAGGVQQGATQTTNAVTVTNSYFNVALDFGNYFDGTARWLAISVKTNGAGSYATLSPRIQLMPNPYALYAPAAGNAGSLTGTLPVAQLTGTVPLTQMPAAVVTNNNATGVTLNGTFSGNGAGMSNVNASQLNGLNATNFWHLDGNNLASGQFLGSTNNQALEIKVNGARALRLEPNAASPNLIGGYSGNVVSNTFWGATIGGGGSAVYPNLVGGSYATVVGGRGNTASGTAATALGDIARASGQAATAMGSGTTASGQAATAMGESTIASGNYSTALGYLSATTNDYTMAAGRQAKAIHQGAYVWADSQNANFASTTNDQFLIRAAGGVGIGTNNPHSALHVVGSITADAFNTTGPAANEPPSGVTPILNMVWIKPGTFVMGSSTNEQDRYSDEGPQTVVTLTRGFWMGHHPVTIGEYTNPS